MTRSLELSSEEQRKMIKEIMKYTDDPFNTIENIEEIGIYNDNEKINLTEKLLKAIDEGDKEKVKTLLTEYTRVSIWIGFLFAYEYARIYNIYLVLTKLKNAILKIIPKATYYRYLKKLEYVNDEKYEDLRRILDNIYELGVSKTAVEKTNCLKNQV